MIEVKQFRFEGLMCPDLCRNEPVGRNLRLVSAPSLYNTDYSVLIGSKLMKSVMRIECTSPLLMGKGSMFLTGRRGYHFLGDVHPVFDSFRIRTFTYSMKLKLF